MSYNAITGRYGFLSRSERELLEAMAYPDQEVDLTINSADVSFGTAYSFPNGETANNYYCRGIRNQNVTSAATIWYRTPMDSTPRYINLPAGVQISPTIPIDMIYGSSGAYSTTTGSTIKCFFKDKHVTKGN